MFQLIIIGKKDFLSESSCERNNFSNNGSANVKELDDFLQMSHSSKGFTPPLPGKCVPEQLIFIYS